MDTKTFLDNFATIADAPGGAQRLRAMVLELALRGRLVAQDPDGEGSADALLELISERSLVTDSNLVDPIEADDGPWEIPLTWRWARLKQITDFSVGRTPPTKDSSSWSDTEGHYWVSIGDMPEGGTVTATKRRVTEKAVAEVFSQPPDPPGTLLMSFKLTIGKVARLAVPAFHNEAIVSITTPFEPTNEYLFRTLPLLTQGGASKAAIMGNTLNKTSLTNLYVPVPPLAEQERIVAKVDELMGLCDDLETRQERRHQATTKFRASALHALTEAEDADDLRLAWERVASSWRLVADGSDGLADLQTIILKLAVSGRLVPQREDESSLDVSGIRATPVESSRLWELPGLSASPTTWLKLPMASLGRWGSGGTPAKSHPEYYGGDIPWVVIGDLNDAVVTEIKGRITDAGLAGSAAKWIPAGSILIAMYGSIGKTGVAGIDCTTNQAIAHCVPNPKVITTEYMFVLARTLKTVLTEAGKGAAQSNISQQVLKHLIVGVPPLDEQRRIVERVERLTLLCDSLGAALVAEEADRVRVSRALTRIA